MSGLRTTTAHVGPLAAGRSAGNVVVGIVLACALALGMVLAAAPGPVVANGPWYPQNGAGSNGWPSVAYGNGTWVAVSRSGPVRVMTSTNAVNWTARTAAEANEWDGVAYGNGQFVALSSDGPIR